MWHTHQPVCLAVETDRATGWSPDRNSRAVLTAAKNHAGPTPETEPGVLAPTRLAQRFGCLIEGLIDYDAEAVDAHSSVRQSDIQQQVVVGESAAGGADRAGFTPDSIVAGQDATITSVPVGGPFSGAARA